MNSNWREENFVRAQLMSWKNSIHQITRNLDNRTEDAEDRSMEEKL